MSVLLEVENLRLSLPLSAGILHAVRGASFSARRGEILCIVGESGCGKSLTSLAIMNLLPKIAIRTADKMMFAGQELQDVTERGMSDIRGARIGMIFQEPMTSLNPSYTIGNQLMEVWLRHRSASRHAARERAILLLAEVGITAAASRFNQYPHQLSGGLRQRVMIAMTLMCDPDLLIADEPTTALDVTIQAQILLLLVKLQRERDMGVILITHDLGIVARVADRVAVMYAGEIVEEGTAAAIFGQPRHPYTQGLLECIPIPGKTRRGGHLGVIPGIVPSLIGEMRGCSFYERCPHASEACANDDIALRTVGGDGEDGVLTAHRYRCVLSAEQCVVNAKERGLV